MKKLIAISLFATLCIYSCNSSGGGKKNGGKDSLGRSYIGCYFDYPSSAMVSVVFRSSDSTGYLMPATRVIQANFKADTVIKKIYPIVDTQWFRRLANGYQPFPLDSMYWHPNLAQMNLDSLLKALPKIKK